MSLIEVKNITKRFGHKVVLDNITLAIDEGDVFGLIGPNGAGKSTLINIMTGLWDSDSGEVIIGGYDLKKEPLKVKEQIGLVPQEIALFEGITAYDNLEFFGYLYGLKGKLLKERINEALEVTGLQNKRKEKVNRFSGGMKRRLNIACAIAHRPKLIIMDEPTVGIDTQSRNHILQSVKALNEMGSTIIYTSHYMEEVEEICTRVAIMDYGKIIAEGTVKELMSMIDDQNSLWISILTGADRISEAEIKEIDGVISVEVDESTVKINSSGDIYNLDRIILYLTERGVSIRNIENKTPNLETVFLTLTGRKLRD